VIFYSPAAFQANHVLPVINNLVVDGVVSVVLVGSFDKIKGCDYYSKIDDLPFFGKYSLYIATDLCFPPAWMSVKTVFFGHGVGPKLDYQSDSSLRYFDYSFTACRPIHEVHKKSGISLVKVGLPILDNLGCVNGMGNGLNSTLNKPLIVYAPSWSGDSKRISPLCKILTALEVVENYRVIVSPHPNFFREGLSREFSGLENSNVKLNYPDSGVSTYEMCMQADVVIGEISSVVFESMAIGRLVCFDGNEKIYKLSGAASVLECFKKSVPVIDWEMDIDSQLDQAMSDTQWKEKREVFIRDYIFNVGEATNIFVKAIYKIIKI
tara:strand:+ start:90344 stop:91312 length:969 start_codon:yes stop_codon:yes gene_type:complete